MEGYYRKEKLCVDVSNAVKETPHFHQDIELIYVLEGTMEITIGEQKTVMSPEDIIVINSDKMHGFNASENILFVKLSISYELISDIYKGADIIFWCDSTKDKSERYDELRKTIKTLLNHYLFTNGQTADFGHISLCYQVMDTLTANFLVQTAEREEIDNKNRFESRLVMINSFIRANYSKHISLKDLSEKLFLSNGYLSRFFKKNYGMSFTEYLSNIRLYHAVDELIYTNAPITRIVYDNGFASVAIFNKSFKKAFGETPSAVRKKSREKKTDDKSGQNTVLIQKRLERFLRDKGVKRGTSYESQEARAVYSVKHSKSFTPVWKQLINAGPAEDLLQSDVQEHIALLKDTFNFTYVRFWNIFSRPLLIDITRPDTEYNFSRLDSILDFLLHVGLKPHIELSQKPKRIQKSVNSALVFEKDAVIFKNIGQWDKVINALIKHLVMRYGNHEIDSWKMELWFNECCPDKQDAAQKYYQLFDHTYEIIRRYSEKLAFGGCGMRTEYFFSQNEKFFINWKKQKHQPDFLSFINYAYVLGKENSDIYSKRNTDTSCLLHGVKSAREDIQAAGISCPKLCITEWNLTISDRNYINDTCFKGAYIIKNVLDVLGKVDELGYFLGSDNVTEYYDSNALLHGGTGILTKDGILKPSGFAFKFLCQLYPYYIGKNENFLITTDRHNSYGIICHNQRRLNYNYYFTKEDEIEKENIYKYFEDSDVLPIHIKLTDMDNGVYQLKTYRINEHNGSILDIWKEMGFGKEISEDDIKYLRKVCQPKLTMRKCSVKSGSIDVCVRLLPNEITFIKINKLS